MSVYQRLRQRTLSVLPDPVRKPLTCANNYVRRLTVWRDVYRLVKGIGPDDRKALSESIARSPLTATRSLKKWADPVLLRDAEVIVREVGRFRLRANSDDLWHVLPTREAEVVNAIRRMLGPGDVFVDAGANIGFYTILASHLVGGAGQVVAIEMMPDTAAVWRGHVELNSLQNCRLIERALSDRTGDKVDAFVTEGKFGQASIAGAGNGRIVEVETTTLDDALAEIPSIRLMKMDLEGVEEAALRGAESVLARTHALIFECWTEEAVVEEFLSARGFSVHRLDGRNRIAVRQK